MAPAPLYDHAVIVANPVSGRGQGAQAASELSEGMNRLGIPTQVHLTTGRGDAFSYLRGLGPEPEFVFAIGGDGTVREVLGGLVEPETPVAILPMGTGNVLASELGLPRDVHHALEIFERHRTTPIDVAEVNGAMSFLVTSVGIDAMTVHEVERRRKGAITKWNYLGAVLHALSGYRPPRLWVTVDDKRLEGEFGLVLISNTIGYGGVLHLAEEARIDDGLFEVYLFPTGKIVELAAAFVRGVVSHLPGGAVTMVRGRRMRIESEQPVPYQVDGGRGGMTPVEVEVSTRQYKIVVP